MRDERNGDVGCNDSINAAALSSSQPSAFILSFPVHPSLLAFRLFLDLGKAACYTFVRFERDPTLAASPVTNGANP